MRIDPLPPAKGPILLCGAVVSDPQGRILLTRTAQDRDVGVWDLPVGPVHHPDSLELAVVQVLHANLGMLVLPLGVLCIAESTEAGHTLSIIYAANMLSRLPRRPTDPVVAEGWFSPRTIPERISPLAVSAIGRCCRSFRMPSATVGR